uniref:Uncharacterized protein n=1 Tax=Rhizophora mucronata TaxID=61149 RepID=A0A2P2NSI6_RHIMU
MQILLDISVDYHNKIVCRMSFFFMCYPFGLIFG